MGWHAPKLETFNENWYSVFAMGAKKKHKKAPKESADDITYEDAYTSSGSADELAQRMEKIKKELLQCKKERQEYLDGWQRMRADVANARLKETSRFARLKDEAVAETLQNLLPVLDSFDMAFSGSGWKQVDKTWRAGMEAVGAQFEQIFIRYGAERFGNTGEVFNPELHEAVKEILANSSEDDGTISEVLRSGWKIGERVLRPAQVVVAHLHTA